MKFVELVAGHPLEYRAKKRGPVVRHKLAAPCALAAVAAMCGSGAMDTSWHTRPPRPHSRRHPHAAAAPAPSTAPAQTAAPAPLPATIKSIRVEGALRIEPETVLSYTKLQVGQNFSNETLDQAIKDLYASDLFADVSISGAESGDIVLRVRENPVINRSCSRATSG